jgi:glycine cleavage system aminomethyltransferase T
MKLDVQDGDLAAAMPLGLDIPESLNGCRLEQGLLVCRQGPRQAAVWDLGRGLEAAPAEAPVTDLTEGLALLALLGGEALSILEKLSGLDLEAAAGQAPQLVQGPVAHVPSQIVLLGDPAHRMVLFTCSRGYGQDMAEVVLEAGSELGLRPAGEKRFQGWLGSLEGGLSQ